MKTKMLYFLIASITLIFTSCTSDENNDNDNLILPKTITYKDKNNKIYQTTTFTYEGNKIVSLSSGYLYIDFIYNGNRIVKEIQYRDFGEGYSEKSYSYSNDSLKTVVKLLNGRETKYVYIDNHNGTIKKEVYKIDRETGKDSETYNVDMLTFEKGNIIKSVLNWADGAYIDTYHYEYDAKNNAFKNILGLNLLLDQADLGSQLNFSSINNIKKYSVSTIRDKGIVPDPYDGMVFKPYSEKSVYEYNKQGYPTKKTSYNEDGSVNETIEYTY